MIIYYDLDTKEILRTENNIMAPIIPSNSTFQEQKEYYNLQNEGFIVLQNEMGAYISSFKLGFNESGSFTGLQPK